VERVGSSGDRPSDCCVARRCTDAEALIGGDGRPGEEGQSGFGSLRVPNVKLRPQPRSD